jgi:hypothetical protein
MSDAALLQAAGLVAGAISQGLTMVAGAIALAGIARGNPDAAKRVIDAIQRRYRKTRLRPFQSRYKDEPRGLGDMGLS